MEIIVPLAMVFCWTVGVLTGWLARILAPTKEQRRVE